MLVLLSKSRGASRSWSGSISSIRCTPTVLLHVAVSVL